MTRDFNPDWPKTSATLRVCEELRQRKVDRFHDTGHWSYKVKPAKVELRKERRKAIIAGL
jgi:hypothetical protein